MKRSPAFMKWFIGIAFIVLLGCNNDYKKSILPSSPYQFDTGKLLITDSGEAKKVKGQLLYLPVYSNVPYFKHGREFELSAFVAIHNTDLSNRLKVSNVVLFDHTGSAIANFLPRDTILNPLATVHFFVPQTDLGSTGANFLVEWVSDSLISEPLIESVMLGLENGQGVSFVSTGKIIREIN